MSNALRRKSKPQFFTKSDRNIIRNNQFERNNTANLVTKAYKDYMSIGYIILHDKFGFGKKRIIRLQNTVNQYLETAADDKSMNGTSLASLRSQK